MKATDTYSRLYHRFADEFPEVWANDRALASWVRLLRIADASWPTRPPLPRSAKGIPLRMLTEAGLVTIVGECYLMRGLDAERNRRKDAAARAADLRWQSARNADALPRRIETRKDETNTDAPHSADADFDGREDLEAFLLVTRRAPTARQRKLLDDVLALRDLSGPEWAANIILSNPADPIGAVIEADKKWREERIAAAKSKERKPARRPNNGTGMTGINQELATYFAQLDRERKATEDDSAA